MTSKLLSSSLYTILSCVILLLFILFSPSDAQSHPQASASTPISPDVACNATLYPNFCKSLLPRNGSFNIYDYGRFSVKQSLLSTRKVLALTHRYLKPSTNLSKNVVRALEDCHLLAGLNMDFLSNTIGTIDSTTNLTSLQDEDMQTLLSAVMTNQQTCFEGLEETASPPAVQDALATPLSDGNKVSSVSLALYKRGWVHNKQKRSGQVPNARRKFLFSEMKAGRYDSLPLKMSSRNRKIFDSVSRRKLLQTGSDFIIVRDIVVVNPDGSGNFTTINDAVAAAPNNTIISHGYFLIYIVSGVYEEYVSIAKNKKNLMILGDGINQTIITGNRSVGDGWSTFNSATFIVIGQGFVGVDITIRNTAGPSKGQAVALRVGADFSTFYSCSFEAYQDTLYTHSLRQFFRECDIYGTVDFIFGNAAVVFQSCNLYARQPNPGQTNMVTAQGRTDPNQNTGTSIQNCNILATPDLASSNFTVKTYLGRPWKQYSRTVYMQSFLDTLIDPSGWDPWAGTFLDTLFYAEFNNTGLGSNTSNRVSWTGYHVINATDAATFTVSNFLLGDDWLPRTGVPYNGGLL